MVRAERFISADDHVQEHPEVWTRRLSRTKWGERIPRLKRLENGEEAWVVDGRKVGLRGVAETGALMGDRAREPLRWDEVPKAAYDPKERLRAMDADGVDYSVLYPSVAGVAGQVFGKLADPDFELACVQAYNDWLVEEWASVSPRFIPQCIVPLFPPEATVAEIKRAVAKGHRGVIYPAVPMELRDVPHINEPVYDPIWATCQDLGVPVCFHAGASEAIQIRPYEGYCDDIAAALRAITRPVSTVSVVVNLLISRVLMRFPNLKVVFGESALGWGAYLLEYTDFQAKGDRLHLEGYELAPSEVFKRQCYLVGWYDRAALKTRHFVGTENILWATNFPLATSTWPNSRDYIARSFEDVPEQDRRKILWENAAKLYRIQ
ncbi:MAG TPA: amidohydrolase family protein [Candidatus Acidoferrales bacterium]|nr:amidohydrolase family protein [Candidatus Acidoferrales bacterium]